MDNLSDREHKENKEIINLVENTNLLGYGNSSSKKKLLGSLGIGFVLQGGVKVSTFSAKPDILNDHLRAAYYCALRDEGLLYRCR